MRKIFVKPSDGVRVTDHLGRAIPPEGKHVCDTHWIRRRIRDGSLEKVETPLESIEENNKW